MFVVTLGREQGTRRSFGRRIGELPRIVLAQSVLYPAEVMYSDSAA
jgi:hypothetical protein